MKKKIWSLALAILLLAMLTGCSRKNYEEAKALLDAGNYAEAKTMFMELGNYEDSETMLQECDYRMAVVHMESEDYQVAQECFAALGTYKDSEELMAICGSYLKYQEAAELMGNWKYTEAREIYLSMEGFLDSDEMAKECLYQMAMSNIRLSKMDKAVEIMAEIPGYKDADAYVEGYKILQTYAGRYALEVEQIVEELYNSEYQYQMVEMDFRIGRFFKSLEQIGDNQYRMTFEVTTDQYSLMVSSIEVDYGYWSFEGYFDFVLGEENDDIVLVFIHDQPGLSSKVTGVGFGFYFDGYGRPMLAVAPFNQYGNLMVDEQRAYICYRKN